MAAIVHTKWIFWCKKFYMEIKQILRLFLSKFFIYIALDSQLVSLYHKYPHKKEHFKVHKAKIMQLSSLVKVFTQF